MSKLTKNFLSALLTVCMLFGALSIGFTIHAADTSFSLDFENETVGSATTNTGITVSNLGSSDTLTVETDPKDPNNKVLQLNKAAKGKKPSMLIKLPDQTSDFTLEYRIMFNGDGQCATVLQSGTGSKLQGVYLVSRAKSDDTAAEGLANCTSASTWNTLFAMGEYNRAEWYSVKIDVDVAAYNYDITVTSSSGVTKTATDSSLRHTGITVFDYLNVQFAGDVVGVIYIDDIKVYTPGQTPENPENPETPDDPEDISKLQEAVAKVEADLTKATTELTKAIADGDKALDTKIAALNEAIEAAKKAYAAADTSLTAKIEAADKTLDDAIKAVQKNLADTKAALEAADKTNADAIAKAIKDLNAAIDSAETVAEEIADAATVELKTELEDMIAEADASLKESIDALTSELQNVKQTLEAKDTEIEGLINTVRVIAIVALAISVISIALVFVGKKRK